jgi:hypothetical protein
VKTVFTALAIGKDFLSVFLTLLGETVTVNGHSYVVSFSQQNQGFPFFFLRFLSAKKESINIRREIKP